MKFLKTIFLLMMFSFISVGVLAHAKLSGSIPQSGQSIEKTPEALQLQFNQPVRLVKVTLTTNEGKPVEFDFKPVMQADKTFRYTLPQLAPATYQVDWVAMSADAHKMSGQFTFILSPTKD